MIITINGEKETIGKEQITISDLLEIKKVKMPEMVSVELNEEFLDKDAFSNTNIKEGDQVEFLYFMGGGSGN
jgi:sulfur carrier protein